jgi:hypothetical protein
MATKAQRNQVMSTSAQKKFEDALLGLAREDISLALSVLTGCFVLCVYREGSIWGTFPDHSEEYSIMKESIEIAPVFFPADPSESPQAFDTHVEAVRESQEAWLAGREGHVCWSLYWVPDGGGPVTWITDVDTEDQACDIAAKLSGSPVVLTGGRSWVPIRRGGATA